MNNSTLFFNFHHTENLIDDLISIFENSNWKTKKAKHTYFHKFLWPDIVLSEKQAILQFDDHQKEQGYDESEDFRIELLGSYNCNCESWNNEGTIVLYYNKILEVTDHYLKDKGIPLTKEDAREFFIETLSTIVLIHEFVHWIMHWIESPDFINKSNFNKGFIHFEYSSIDNVEFHEGFAQLFTSCICESNSYLEDMFNWLVVKQPSQYKVYEQLKKIKKEDSINNAIHILEFTRSFNLQSFAIAKSLSLRKEIKNSSSLPFDDEEYTTIEETFIYSNTIEANNIIKELITIKEIDGKVKEKLKMLLTNF